ncbi:MAG TPA: hypothetical protein ENN08_05345 [Bacteroidales bacterium]|nr:hypothetical protein [Bacteroidales bacterium]
MRHIFAGIFMLSGMLLLAQDSEQTETKKAGIRFTGFVKSDYWYDSRQVVAAREDLFLLFPSSKRLDLNGEDINARPTFNYSAITSRLTGIISGPDAFGAETSGVIEADFSGVTNADINGFRLRHAYAKLRWEKSELLFGQYWHPMFVPEVFPNVISLNTGAPFQPFIRNPQIAYKHYSGDFNISLTLISQRDNSSDGPAGFSPQYMRNSLMPNAHLQLQHKTENHVWGLAADYKVLQPRLETSGRLKTNESIGSYAFMVYHKFRSDQFLWSAKTIYGQNLTEHLMMGGYAVRSFDELTMFETYTPTNHLNFWSFISYGNHVRLGLFGGFLKNFGTTHKNTGIYYARGHDIDYLYRLAPSVSFISNNVQISTELEYTAAAFGSPDQKGKVQNSEEIGNLRLLLTFFYFF